MAKKVIVIGAGLSGLALATELVDEGFEVDVLEQNPYLGGRASDMTDRVTHDPVPIGPHVLCGFYSNFFRFQHKIGAPRNIEWERDIFIDVLHGRTRQVMRLHKYPGPLYTLPWLLSHPELTLRDVVSNVRFVTFVWFASGPRLESLDSETAIAVLRKFGVTEKCIDVFWRFIVLSLLNVSIEVCSAAEFTLLVKKWARLKHRKFGFPKVGLGDLYADEARRYITARGGTVRHSTCVTRLHCGPDGSISGVTTLHSGIERSEHADIYVAAMTPLQLGALLEGVAGHEEARSHLAAFQPVPYISVHLWFDKKVTRKKFWALRNELLDAQYLNTDFYDFSNIYEHHGPHSYIASNIINSGPYEHLSDDEIIARTLEEVRVAIPHMTAKLKHARVRRIPYVVYAPTTGMRAHRIGPRLVRGNMYVAGDWIVPELPQCMEAATRGAYMCAEAVLEDAGISRTICDHAVS